MEKIIETLKQDIPNLLDEFTEDEVREIVKNNPDHFKDLVEAQYAEWFVDLVWDTPIRRCSECGKLMRTGYYLNGDYACSDECRNKIYKTDYDLATDAEAEAQYLEECELHDSDYYYTEW